ncbi:MAG: hypothetical protein AAF564_05785 [Bacteroidota bacterium]
MYSKISIFSFFILLGIQSCKSLEPVTWILEPTIDTSEIWDTNKDPNEPVLSLNCVNTFGANHLMTGLAGFKEPATNLDRFMARLIVDCVEHIEFGGKYLHRPIDNQNPTVLTTYLSFRTGSSEQPIDLESGQLPIGLAVTHTNNNYVKNLQFLYVTENQGILSDYTDPDYTAETITDYPAYPRLQLVGTNPHVTFLQCGSQEVMTGIRVRQNSNNGKIRMVGIHCQLLRRDESATPES